MKQLTIFIILLLSYNADAQLDKEDKLFISLKTQDSIFFELGFNQCDLEYLKKHIANDLTFYHDQGGIQDRDTFFENTEKYICSDGTQKPIRKVDAKSLEVFPLYQNGELYGAIQNGTHNFYLREKNKDDIWTSTAKFTHVWLLENDTWILAEVLSFDHQEPTVGN